MSFHDFIERAWAYGVRPSSRRKITAQQMYPWAVERQLQANLKAEFVKAGMYYKEQALKGTQSFKDNTEDLADAEYDNDERIRPLAERVAYEVEKFQQACFENFSDVVIGERYVPAVVGPSITDTWQENFLTLCRSTNDDLKRRVSAIISDAVMNGNNIADTARQIDEAVGHYSYSKAMTIARTETGKLNMALSKAQMEEAGIDKYEWSCMMDERSRPSHEKMDGKVCIWSNPNVVYNIKTKKTEPRPQSAVHLHPGDDYNCRCVALPWDELIEEELNKKKGKPNKQWLELKEEEKRKEAARRAEREEIKRNKELVPQLTAENEKLQNRLDKMSQELLDEQLESKGLEETLILRGKKKKETDTNELQQHVVYVRSDSGTQSVTITASSRQEAKYILYKEIMENPGKYGPNAVVPKFDPKKYEKENNIKVVTITKPLKNTPDRTVIVGKTETENILPDDIKDLSEKIKSGKMTANDLNDEIFDGKKVINDITAFKELPDNIREKILYELKHTPFVIDTALDDAYVMNGRVFLDPNVLTRTDVIHEYTHVFDGRFKGLNGVKMSISVDNNFGKSIYDEFVKDFIKGLHDEYETEQKLQQLFKQLESKRDYEADEDIFSTVCDWIGLSGNNLIAHSHDIGYADDFMKSATRLGLGKDQAKYAALSIEGFAEFSQMLASARGKSFAEKFLPKTLKKYYSLFEENYEI